MHVHILNKKVIPHDSEHDIEVGLLERKFVVHRNDHSFDGTLETGVCYRPHFDELVDELQGKYYVHQHTHDHATHCSVELLLLEHEVDTVPKYVDVLV